jgi:hypothetical protein
MDSTDRQKDDAVLASSNAVRLSPREGLLAALVVGAVLVATPLLWERYEAFSPGADFRMPYRLGEDYWLYGRYGGLAASDDNTLVVGDSVVWGHYVARDETFSHYLNAAAGEQRYVNLGVDGIHPAAMAGLLRYYGRGIGGRRVILHCNPLWMASERHDLRGKKKEFRLNHPRLMPQFHPHIPSYDERYSERVGVCVERLLPFRDWARHLQAGYFGGSDIPSWTVERPYDCPVRAVGGKLDLSDTRPRYRPANWQERGIVQQDFPWVRLRASLQWRFFRESLDVLRARGNRVFVVVGPFNEHMLTDASQRTYAALRAEMVERLKGMGVPCFAPPVLPSAEYADASHPLAAGYARLAGMLRADESFVRFNAGEGRQ